MREQAVPCINASPWAVKNRFHMTFADDRLCGRCRPSSAALPGGEAGSDTRASRVLPASSSLSGFLSKPARDAQQCAAGDGPAPVVGNP